ncbi:MAG: NADH:ubiquinone reductase (Na(+)-transporting) subunit D [Chlamydiales bacterium]|nr:NADH:ubiquinone reductase (Na(+)-transporting) subunit D [Chlamydiales bacterium]NCF70187.1 NADH:ubiquinone reductase (Na(+)-transporting) subunit D [Chlamydiales bacterium]
MASKTPLAQYFTEQIWKENQVLVAILGICSALAVTTSLPIALTMTAAVCFVTACSSFCVSLIRKFTPDSVRMIAQLAVISTFVTIVDQILKAHFFELWKQLTVFIALIITNCLVMGRAEGMARNVGPIPAFLDGLGAGLGYGIVLCIVAFLRELFGFGTLFGIQIIPESFYASAAHPDLYQNNGLMVLPPSAFVILGFMVWIAKVINKKRS